MGTNNRICGAYVSESISSSTFTSVADEIHVGFNLKIQLWLPPTLTAENSAVAFNALMDSDKWVGRRE